MKRILSISLLSIFLFSAVLSATAWIDMYKISNLIEHYKEHKKVDSSISFWSFIDLHYGKNFEKHQMAHDHSKLPLKSATHPVFAYFISDIQNSFFYLYTTISEPSTQSVVPHFYKRLFSQNLSDIWQPPRAC